MGSSRLRQILTDQVFTKLGYGKHFALHIGVLSGGKKVFSSKWGNEGYDLFDWASMTKSIFTAAAFQHFCPELLNRRVSGLVPWAHGAEFRVSELLSHSSKLKAHRNYFLKLRDMPANLRLLTFRNLLRKELEHLGAPIPTYSDIGFFFLAEILKYHSGKDLLEVWLKISSELGYPKNIHFNPDPCDFARCAPTENRGGKVQGEVFDDNCEALGGVSTHAGLFGSIKDLLGYGKLLRQWYYDEPGNKVFKTHSEGWGLGYMKPSGVSTAGNLFSKKSIGHLGFTGTSFWFDPKVDLFVGILCNRTYPNRNNDQFNKFRPIIHNIIYREFIK